MEKFNIQISRNLIWRIYRVDVDEVADTAGNVAGYILSKKSTDYTKMGRRYYRVPRKLFRRNALTIENTFDTREDAMAALDKLINNHISNYIRDNQKMIDVLLRRNADIQNVKPKGQVINYLPVEP